MRVRGRFSCLKLGVWGILANWEGLGLFPFALLVGEHLFGAGLGEIEVEEGSWLGGLDGFAELAGGGAGPTILG